MIVSFGDRATAALYHGERGKAVRKFPSTIRRVALRKLDVLNGAPELGDLRSPPGNRLEALRGDLNGLHSIRVNDQWRIVFRWVDGDAHDVRIVDYR
jgi:addiction module HigA family antidote